MTKRNTLKVLVVLLLILNAVIIGLLLMGRMNGSKKPHANRGPHMEQDIIQRFKFDESQSEAFADSREKHQLTLQGLKEQLTSTSESYYKTKKSDEVRDSLLSQITETTIKIYEANQQHFDEVRQLCKPDQADELNELIKHLLNRHQGNFKKGQPRGPN